MSASAVDGRTRSNATRIARRIAVLIVGASREHRQLRGPSGANRLWDRPANEMSEVRNCGVAADTKVETPEGSMTVRSCAGKAIPVLSRNADKAILFRMMLDVRKVAEIHPVLKITLENGGSFRVAPEQILYRAD